MFKKVRIELDKYIGKYKLLHNIIINFLFLIIYIYIKNNIFLLLRII